MFAQISVQRSINAVFLLHLLEILLPSSNIFSGRSDLHLLGLMVEDDQISVHEVEAIQSVAGILRIHNILIDDIGCSLGVVCGTSSYLSEGTVLAEKIEEGRSIDIVGQILDEKDAVGFGCQLVASRHAALPVEEKGKSGGR